mgnify:CR=1 FL=1
MRIIDAHVHVGDNYKPMTPFQDNGRVDRLLRLMDECEVEKAVMVPDAYCGAPTGRRPAATSPTVNP